MEEHEVEITQHAQNAPTSNNLPTFQFNPDFNQDDIKSEPSADDSKDLTDIQSVLNMEEMEHMQRERVEKERKHKTEEQKAQLEKEEMEKQKLKQKQRRKRAKTIPTFTCNWCKNSFAECPQCWEHIKSLHAQEYALLLSKGVIENETESPQVNSNNKDKRQRSHEDTGKGGKYSNYINRKFSCIFCMKRFRWSRDLHRHIRTHSGEKPFQCEICFRKFSLKKNMLTHMRTHSGEKLFQCEICFRKFSQKTNMLRHKRTHSGEKPFQCEICFRKFSHKNIMVTHMKKHSCLNTNGSQATSDNLPNGNYGSDYSDDKESFSTFPASAMSLPNASINALYMVSKIQELLNKANEWRNGSLNILGDGKETNSEETNTPQTSDLIGNLLGISDQDILNKLISSPDEAAKFLGVEK